MCKHFNTPQGCSYGDKCQFAHGPQDLRSFPGQGNQGTLRRMELANMDHIAHLPMETMT